MIDIVLIVTAVTMLLGHLTYCLTKSRCTKFKTPCIEIDNSPPKLGEDAGVSLPSFQRL